MRLSSFVLLISPLFLMTACSSTPPPETPPQSPPVATVIKEDFIRLLDANFRGQLSFGDGDGVFIACGTNEKFPVKTNTALRNIYGEIAPAKYTPVYIEFSGEIAFPKVTSKSSVAAHMRVDRVHHMALAKTSLQCAKPVDNFLFKASGDDPYWRLNIDGEKLYFATKASNQAYNLQDANFETTQINHVKSISSEDERLDLTIEPGHCYDLKNNEYWGFTTRVDSRWGQLDGCGEPGWASTGASFTGYYLNETDSKTINLTLNSDYSVEYNEKIDGREIVKSGFWKNNSPDRVVIMFTQQGKQKLREEVIFMRKGVTLVSSRINKNNIVTELPAPGLIFNKMNSKEISAINAPNRVERALTAQQINPTPEVDIEIQKAVNEYFKIHRTDPSNTKFNSVKYDLNGDGIEDAIVLLDWCSSNGCEMLIFEGSKLGYRFSSRVSSVQPPLIVASSQHYLWQSLLTEKNQQWLKLDFDGISYPSQTENLSLVNKERYATGVVLFDQGRPKNWFPVKI
jgi:putative lipoprotein